MNKTSENRGGEDQNQQARVERRKRWLRGAAFVGGVAVGAAVFI